jgi:hypothetical protein
LRRFLDASLDTEQQARTLVYLDEDDPVLGEYRKINYPHWWTVHVGQPVGLGGVYKWVFETFPNLDYYGFLGDDLIPRTKHWDEKLIEAAGVSDIAYGDDGYWGEKLATHPCVGGELVRHMGWLCYPGLNKLFIDTVWHTIGVMLGRLHYLPDVKLEHMHYLWGKAEHDETYGDQAKGFAHDQDYYSKFLHEWAPVLENEKDTAL